MKNLFVVALILIFSLSNCGEPSVVKNITTKIERIPVELTEDDLFKGNKIMAFLENEIKFLQQANELFLKGLNSFRNEKDLDSAHYYLQNSILTEPSAKAYFELGNVYMDKKEYPSALLAFGVAEQLNYEPFSKILYNKACLYSMQEEEAMAAKYLEFALQAGYNNIEHINKDEDLDKLRKTRHYKKAI